MIKPNILSEQRQPEVGVEKKPGFYSCASLISAFLGLVIILVAGGWFYYYQGPCGVNKVRESTKDLNAKLTKFEDTVEIAGSTSTIGTV